MQLRPLPRTSRIGTTGGTPPPWVRVRCSAIGLVGDFLASRQTLGQVVLQGEAVVPGDLTVHLAGQSTLVIPLQPGDTASDAAFELAARILNETPYDALVRARGAGFAVALGVKVEVV
jgi:hypothetical protein